MVFLFRKDMTLQTATCPTIVGTQNEGDNRYNYVDSNSPIYTRRALMVGCRVCAT